MPEQAVTALRPPEADAPDPLRLGIERSTASTLTWIGYEEYEEHAAAESEVEQAAMAMAEFGGNEGSAEPDAPEPPTPAPAEERPAPSLPPEAIATPPIIEEAPSPGPVVVKPPVPSDPMTPDDDEVEETGEEEMRPDEPTAEGDDRAPAHEPEPAETAPVPSAPPAPTPTRTPVPAPSPQPRPVQEGGGRAGPGSGDLLGDLTDRESIASALKGAVKVRPGKPLATEGLEIMTVRPQWALTTLMTALPRNPALRIRFGRDGRVREAKFLPGLSTGDSRVDGPLLNAVYRWRAKGAPLEALPDDEPDGGGAGGPGGGGDVGGAGIVITVEVILVG